MKPLQLLAAAVVLGAATAAMLELAEKPSAEQRKALAAIERLRGRVRRDEKNPGWPVVEADPALTKVTDEDLALLAGLPEIGRKALAAIKRLGGRVRRDEKNPGWPVVEVDLALTKVTDEDLTLLAGLPELRRLNLRITLITDKGLENLKVLSRLEELTLVCPYVTEKGIAHLHGMAGLRRLVLYGVRIEEEQEQRLRWALPKAKIDMGNGN
jgi:hypothetical protein